MPWAASSLLYKNQGYYNPKTKTKTAVGISSSHPESKTPAEQTCSQPESKPLPQTATIFLLPLFAFLSHRISHPWGAQSFLLWPVEGTVQCSKMVQNSLVGPLPGKGVPHPSPPSLADLTFSTQYLRWAGTKSGFPCKAGSTATRSWAAFPK